MHRLAAISRCHRCIMNMATMAIVRRWNGAGNLGLLLLEGIIGSMEICESGRGTNKCHLIVSRWLA